MRLIILLFCVVSITGIGCTQLGALSGKSQLHIDYELLGAGAEASVFPVSGKVNGLTIPDNAVIRIQEGALSPEVVYTLQKSLSSLPGGQKAYAEVKLPADFEDPDYAGKTALIIERIPPEFKPITEQLDWRNERTEAQIADLIAALKEQKLYLHDISNLLINPNGDIRLIDPGGIGQIKEGAPELDVLDLHKGDTDGVADALHNLLKSPKNEFFFSQLSFLETWFPTHFAP